MKELMKQKKSSGQKRKVRIVLASASPRRREILAQGGLEFEVVVSHADENVQETDPARLVEALALRKGQAVAKQLSSDQGQTTLVIGADTIVVLDGEVLGKPADPNEAFAMLKELSGKTHQVMTGVSLSLVEDGEIKDARLFHEVTDVVMRPLSHEEIREYVNTGDPLDKAGAYGIQGMAGMFIPEIRGDYYNVVGLPLCAAMVQIREIMNSYMNS